MRRDPVALTVLTVALAVVLAALVGCSTATPGGAGSAGGTVPAAGESPDSGSSSGGVTVSEQDFAFNPANATVKVGETVTFTNNDSAPHNVSIDGKELGSQGPGESKTWTAPGAGAFPFSCTIHPSMTGEITVE